MKLGMGTYEESNCTHATIVQPSTNKASAFGVCNGVGVCTHIKTFKELPKNPNSVLPQPNRMHKPIVSHSQIKPGGFQLTIKRHPRDVIQWCLSIV